MNTEKPVLFWDFHGTLTLPDLMWFDTAMEAATEHALDAVPSREALIQNLSGTCLPWFTVPGRDTRHLSGSERWWAHSEGEFVKMFMRCGLSRQQAEAAAPAIREKVLEPHRYALFPDAIPTLQTLQNAGYKNVILSNNFPELPHLVEALGLAPYFAEVISSGVIGYDKPHPGIFEYARRFAGAATPWMIGDNPVDDIEGGAAAGFVTVAVHSAHGAQSPVATHTVDALCEIPPLLTESS